jgi:hypothetical protein
MKKIMVLVLLMCAAFVSAAPLGQWLLNEGSGDSAADSSGNGADLALDYGSGSWVYEHPQYGTGFSFGATQRFTASYPAEGFAFDMSQDFILSMTISANPSYSNATLMGRYSDEAWAYGGKTLNISNGMLNWQCNGIGSLTGTTNVADGSFHDIAVQYDATTGVLGLYVDGDLDTSGDFSNMALVTDVFDFHLGSHIAIEGSLYQPYFGIMSDVAITPEPATLALLGLGGLMLRRKR